MSARRVEVAAGYGDLSASPEIGARHFGANVLFDRDGIHRDGFDAALEGLGVTHLRYPGGTIAETLFDLARPNAPRQHYLPSASPYDPDGSGPATPRMLGLDDFLDLAKEAGAAMSFVMPTIRFAGTTRDARGNRYEDVDADLVHGFVQDLLEGARARGVTLQAIELGNEWWVDHSGGWGETLSAVEYGRIASRLAAIVQRAIDDFQRANGLPADGPEPDILVQVGPGGRAEMVTPDGDRPPAGYDGPLVWATELIFEEFAAFEGRALDGTLTHHYLAGGRDMIDGWRYQPFEIWDRLAAARPDIDTPHRYVTEWNVKSTNEAMFGLAQAGAMVALFAELLEAGVDHANVWPIQQNVPTRLSRTIEGPGGARTVLTAAGEAFAMMEGSLGGLTHIPVAERAASADVTLFGGDESWVLFVANEGAGRLAVDLDLSDLIPEAGHYWGTVLTTREADRLDPDLVPLLVTRTGGELVQKDGDLAVRLGGWELLRVEITREGLGVEIAGQDRADRMVGTGAGDRMWGGAGADAMQGRAGADRLWGGAGTDAITGGPGLDRLWGGAGADRLAGAEGHDRLWGQRGDDALAGGAGRDRLAGGAGDDRLAGGAGDDLLFGGAGADILFGGAEDDRLLGGAGDDRLVGGAGADIFVFRPGDGADRIADFDPAEDRLRFEGFDPDAADIVEAATRSHGNVVIAVEGLELTLEDMTLAGLAEAVWAV